MEDWRREVDGDSCAFERPLLSLPISSLGPFLPPPLKLSCLMLRDLTKAQQAATTSLEGEFCIVAGD